MNNSDGGGGFLRYTSTEVGFCSTAQNLSSFSNHWRQPNSGVQAQLQQHSPVPNLATSLHRLIPVLKRGSPTHRTHRDKYQNPISQKAQTPIKMWYFSVSFPSQRGAIFISMSRDDLGAMGDGRSQPRKTRNHQEQGAPLISQGVRERKGFLFKSHDLGLSEFWACHQGVGSHLIEN